MNAYLRNALRFNRQLSLDVIRTERKLKAQTKPDAVVVVGMGGSGLAGELLQKLTPYVKLAVPVIPWKNFGFPHLPYAKHPLYLFVSFSGNTKEVLDGITRLLRAKRGATVGVVTAGGKLEAIARERELPTATFQAGGLEPRQATGLLFYGCLTLLRHVWNSVEAPDLRTRIRPERLRGEAKRIARAIGSKGVAIIAEANEAHLAYYWKAHLNEAGKTFASWNVLPEANHNEIVGFELKLKNIITLFLAGNPKDKRAEKIREVTESAIRRFGNETITVQVPGKNPLERTMHSLALAGLTSIEVAGEKRVDPQETRIIAEIKKRISKFR